MTRQREWQIKKVQDGLCPGCGKQPKIGYYCKSCRMKRREMYRNLYRRKHDIPVDFPMANVGRPRID